MVVNCSFCSVPNCKSRGLTSAPSECIFLHKDSQTVAEMNYSNRVMDREIKVGDVYSYVFSRNSTEFETVGEKDLDIKITYIRSGVVFYTVEGHPELGEKHFETGSYMARNIVLKG